MKRVVAFFALTVLLLTAGVAMADEDCVKYITVDKVVLKESVQKFDFALTGSNNTVYTFKLSAQASPRVIDVGDGIYSLDEVGEEDHGWRLVPDYPNTYCYADNLPPATTWFSPDRIDMSTASVVHCVFTNDAAPLGVDVEAFTGAAQPDGVFLEWYTTVQVDTFGYNVRRATDPYSDGEQINPVIIPAVGAMAGVYRYTDVTARPSKLYYYTLRVVGLDGRERVAEVIEVAYKPAFKYWYPIR